jgi:voltage-gated potassium channel
MTKPRGRHIVRVMLRSFVSAIVMVALYYVLPLGESLDAGATVLLLCGLAVFTLIVAWHLRAILRSDFPALRAVEALATTVPLFLLIFASTYYLMDNAGQDSFSQQLTRTDSLYFTITVFSTVGFGDITPTTEATRIVTMAQMLIDVVIIGALARVLLGAVRTAQSKQRNPAAERSEE